MKRLNKIYLEAFYILHLGGLAGAASVEEGRSNTKVGTILIIASRDWGSIVKIEE